MAAADDLVTFSDFQRLRISVAEVTEAKPHPNADRLLVLTARAGGQARQLVAGIRADYDPQGLVGRLVVMIENLEPAVIRGVRSEGMILAATDSASGKVRLLTVDGDAAPGSRIS